MQIGVHRLSLLKILMWGGGGVVDLKSPGKLLNIFLLVKRTGQQQCVVVQRTTDQRLHSGRLVTVMSEAKHPGFVFVPFTSLQMNCDMLYMGHWS